ANAATVQQPGRQPAGKLVSINVSASCTVLKLPTRPTGVLGCENTSWSTRLVWKVNVAKPFLCSARHGRVTASPGAKPSTPQRGSADTAPIEGAPISAKVGLLSTCTVTIIELPLTRPKLAASTVVIVPVRSSTSGTKLADPQGGDVDRIAGS